MRVKTNSLYFKALDWAVMIADGKRSANISASEIISGSVNNHPIFEPSSNWWHAGEIIEKHCILFDTDDKSIIWAKIPGSEMWSGSEDHRSSACRAVVDAKLGKEFEADFPDFVLSDIRG